ncbi:hypothetical protein [Haladaptatus sp. NG-SE-30]
MSTKNQTTLETIDSTLIDFLDEDDEHDCEDTLTGFPCWPCVRDGRRELPEVEDE